MDMTSISQRGAERKFRTPNPPAAAVADQASSEGGGHDPPAGDGATRRPKADSNSEFRISARYCLAVLLTVSVLVVVPASTAFADAIVVTKAMTASTVVEISIEESEIVVEMEIGVPDLLTFHNLLPDEMRARMGLDAAPLSERLALFFREDFVIRANGGPPLPGRVTKIEPRRRVPRDELTGEPLPAAEGEGEPVVFVVLSYDFSGQPKTLTFHPPTAGGDFPAATIGFITYHLGVPAMDFRYLGAESTIDLDWDDPWFSKFRNRNLWRQYDSPLNVFLYVEPYEVRVEIIARPRDVQKWADVGVGGLKTIPVEIQGDVKQKVADFFAESLDFTIDGEAIAPALDRVNFLERTLRTSTVINPPRELDAAAATLGVIFLHPTTGYPQEANVIWNHFIDRVDRIPAAATDEAGPLRFFLMPDDNILWWKNFLKNPTMPTLVDVQAPPSSALRGVEILSWIALAVLGFFVIKNGIAAAQGKGPRRRAMALVAVFIAIAGGSFVTTSSSRIDDERAEEIVSSLLHNVYRAFDFREEETIYDTLAHSVSGDLLTQTYLETRRGLELASQGGARAKVQEIEMLEVESESEGPGFRAISTWNVAASVGHWGHIHQRRNQYIAEILVEPVDGVWKITSLELIEEKRL